MNANNKYYKGEIVCLETGENVCCKLYKENQLTKCFVAVLLLLLLFSSSRRNSERRLNEATEYLKYYLYRARKLFDEGIKWKGGEETTQNNCKTH